MSSHKAEISMRHTQNYNDILRDSSQATRPSKLIS